jgi:hypothetical protein
LAATVSLTSSRDESPANQGVRDSRAIVRPGQADLAGVERLRFTREAEPEPGSEGWHPAERRSHAYRKFPGSKQRDAEHEADRLRVENVKLTALLDAVRTEAEQLSELKLRISSAKHVSDLFGGAK